MLLLIYLLVSCYAICSNSCNASRTYYIYCSYTTKCWPVKVLLHWSLHISITYCVCTLLVSDTVLCVCVCATLQETVHWWDGQPSGSAGPCGEGGDAEEGSWEEEEEAHRSSTPVLWGEALVCSVGTFALFSIVGLDGLHTHAYNCLMSIFISDSCYANLLASQGNLQSAYGSFLPSLDKRNCEWCGADTYSAVSQSLPLPNLSCPYINIHAYLQHT